MRKLIGLLLLLALLLFVAWWSASPHATPAGSACNGSPILVTYHERESLFCVSSLSPQALVDTASISGSCRGALLALPSLRTAEHITLSDHGASCEASRSDIPASQRFILGLPLNVNTATQQDLETLPGLGPSVAKAIIEDRSTNGPYKSIDELDRVKGIGPKLLEKLRPFVFIE